MTQYTRLNEPFFQANLNFIEPLAEAEGGIQLPMMPRKVVAIGGTANVVNANGHYYPVEVLQSAITEAMMNMRRGIPLTGQLDHPDECEEPELEDVAVNWTAIRLNGDLVELEGLLTPDKNGQKVISLMAVKVPVGISLRGYGLISQQDMGGQIVDVITELHLEAYDFVLKPADANGAVKTLEAKKTMTTQESPVIATGAPLTLADLKKGQPELVAQLLAESDATRQAEQAKLQAQQDALNAKLAEKEAAIRQVVGVGNEADLMQVLESQAKQVAEAKAIQLKAEIEAVLDEGVKGTRFPDGVNKSLKESVLALNPKSAQEAKDILARQLPIFNGLMAQQYMSDKGAAVMVLGPVFESQTNYPEFAQPAYALMESYGKQYGGKMLDLRKTTRPNDAFAAKVVEAFIRNNANELKREYRRWSEAEQSSDLNLPYAVNLAVIMQALPNLVASTVFDMGTMTSGSAILNFERYTAESGTDVTITALSVVAAHGTWVALTGGRINWDVVVKDSTNTTTYTYGTDYVIDHIDGNIKVLSGGTIADGATIKVSYTYSNLRSGEMNAIAMAKLVIDRVTVTAAADRLGTQISSEAMKFGRSDLNWDATLRTIEALSKEMMRHIDHGMFYNGLSAALGYAANSGGTWSKGTDTIEKLVEYIDNAWVKVANRYYTPDAIVMSKQNAAYLSRWVGFTSAGTRNGDSLQPNGEVGFLAGKQVISTTEIPDAYILVCNRQLVMHRVYSPMQLDGPHPSYDSNQKMVAAKMYYLEEMNATAVPVPEKGAYVAVTA